MIKYKITLGNGGKSIWRIRQTKDIYHYERLWREGKYVGPKSRFKINENGMNPSRIWVA